MKIGKLTLLVLIATIAIALSHGDHQCKHGNHENFNLNDYPTTDYSFEDSHLRNLQSSSTQPERPFKISYDFSYFKNTPNTDAVFSQKVEQLMAVVTKYFSNLIKTVPRGPGQMKWTLERRVCGGGNLLAKIPESDRQDDKDVDLHLYLVYMNEPSQSYVAYAAACRELPGSGPTHGQVTFNYAWFKGQTLTDNKIFLDMQGTLIHEIIHVLGFQEVSYKNWIDRNTKTRYPQVTVTSQARGSNVQFIATPNVKKLAQEYYNCSTLPGMPLENQGSSGSAGSHWESTLMVDEMMKSTVIKTQNYLSPFTIALLKDTGYYSYVNEDMADQYFYGKGLGCDFVLGACNADKFKSELCTKETEKPENQCDYYGNGQTTCSSGTFLDPQCFQRTVDERGRCFDKVGNRNGSSLYTLFYGQYFGEDSRCFMSSLVQKFVGSTYDFQGSCYKFECFEEEQKDPVQPEKKKLVTKLKVYAGTQSQVCEEGGKDLSFTGYIGVLRCPQKIDQFCQFKRFCPNHCASNGYCSKGKCVCINGFSGPSCEIKQ